MDLPIDFATLRVLWWGLLGVLLIAFALTDGFDLGVGALLPFVARTDEERRMVINTVGATWEGNQVWFILGAAPSSPPGRSSMRSASRASTWPCSWCCPP